MTRIGNDRQIKKDGQSIIASELARYGFDELPSASAGGACEKEKGFSRTVSAKAKKIPKVALPLKREATHVRKSLAKAGDHSPKINCLAEDVSPIRSAMSTAR